MVSRSCDESRGCGYNKKGKKIFRVAKSYLPAQDIHIAKNPVNNELGPWYEVGKEEMIIRPERKFIKKAMTQLAG